MRLSITHHTVRKGFLFQKTYYEVQLHLSLTHEEKQIIRQRNLHKTEMLQRRPANARFDDRDAQFTLVLNDVMNGQVDAFLCANPSDAKIYEERLLSAFQQVKLWLDDNAEVAGRTVVDF